MINTSMCHQLEDSFLEQGKLYMIGDIDTKMLYSTMMSMEYLRQREDIKDIYIFIYTEGGDPECASGIIDEINGAKSYGKKIHIIGISKVYSAGADILVQGDVRYGTEDCSFMLHGMSYRLSQDYHKQNKAYIEFYEKLENRGLVAMAMKLGMTTKKSIDKFIEKVVNDSMWLDLDEAIKIGLIDKKWDYRILNKKLKTEITEI